MAELEKVMKALKCCTAYYIDGDLTGHKRCPYNGRNGGDGCDKLYADVLELLKEKEPVYPTWQQGKMFCGACGAKFPSRTMMRFCHRCGREIRLKVNDN